MLTLICKLLVKGGLTMTRYCNCSKAFNSIEEANEWQFLISRLENAESLPIEIRIKCSENLDRLKRHGYSAELTDTPNMYQLTKRDK